MPRPAPARFLHRDLEWLDFNSRVLAEAENPALPLLDRVKFVAIASSNLDEFLAVRVANLKRWALDDVPDPLSGLAPSAVLSEVAARIEALLERQQQCLHAALLPALAERGVRLVAAADLTDADKEYLGDVFESRIAPTLTPMALDPGHPFPLLASAALYLGFAVRIRPEAEGMLFCSAETVLMQVPGGLERFLALPAIPGEMRLVALEDVIRLFSRTFLSGYELCGTYAFRVIRDARTIVDDAGAADLLGAVDEAVRSRRWGAPVAVEASADMPPETLDKLCAHMEMTDRRYVFRYPRPLGLRALHELVALAGRPDLQEPPWPPQPHPQLSRADVFAAIRERDCILRLPYQDFEPISRLIEDAAADPQVLAIKITLYRFAGDSRLIKGLINAARQGKQVTALVELRARFDERNNITWARALDAAGAHVIYGVVGYKTHSKVLLIVRREDDGIRRYVHLATGNYNDRTARVYTDVGLFTARPDFGRDISGFFNVITGYSLPPKWNHIVMAPTGLRQKILALIAREAAHKAAKGEAFIRAKMNSLIDPEVIEALYAASKAGVQIDLLVRGICRLRPGVAGLSTNIRVRSVIDRFLEHSRVFHFHNGGQDEVYVSSADWMERNFDDRLELLFPILDPECQKQVLAVLDAGFADNVKAWEMRRDGGYARVPRPEEPRARRRSQEMLWREAVAAATPPPPPADGVFQVKVAKKRKK